MYNLIIKGGTVIDSQNHINGKFDIGVIDGKVAEISPEIDPNLGRRILNVKGKVVLPGIIDMHIHTGFTGKGGRVAMTMAVKAGTVTAMDCAGPLHEFYDFSINNGTGMNMICLQMIRPGWNVRGVEPFENEIENLIDKSLDDGALGMKLLGGHYPMTMEATQRVVEVANKKKAYVAFHVGTTENGVGNFNSFKDAIKISEGLSMDLVHVNSYCRGQILGDPVIETLEALSIIEAHPNIFSESYLAVFSGTPVKCTNGELESNGPKNSLSMGGYEGNERGLRKAILDGWASVVAQRGDENVRLTGQEGIEHFESEGTDVTGTFPVTPASTRFLLATQKGKSGRFIIDAIATDGGSIPRNFIVEKGTALVRMDMLTWEEFITKTSLNPARIFGFKDKGHLGIGADADITVLEGTSGRAYSAINGGKIIMIDGVVVGNGTIIITTERGVKAVEEQGLNAKVVDLTKGWFYGGRPVK